MFDLQTSTISNQQLQRGYTLIEVLIASSLFVGVLIVSMTTLATVSRLRERTQVLERLTEAGRLVTEQVVRQARDARGLRDGSGTFTAQFAPFRFIEGTRDGATDQRQSTALQVADFEIVDERSVGTVTTVELVAHPRTPSLQTLQATVSRYSADPLPVVTDVSPPEQLLPDTVGIQPDSFSFTGLGHEDTSTTQPFLQIEATLVAIEGETVSQTTLPLRTAVTSRVFAR